MLEKVTDSNHLAAISEAWSAPAESVVVQVCVCVCVCARARTRSRAAFSYFIAFLNIIINTFYLGEQIHNFLKNNNFKSEIKVIDDGKKILDTGGGILNMLNHSKDDNVLIFNPDTIWRKSYFDEIIKMEDLYFSNKAKNILLLVNKQLSFDKNFNGDFDLKKNLILKTKNRKFIYTGCQILSKELFNNYLVDNFSIVRVWNSLIKKNELYGFESNNDFYHLTDLQTFKKLQDL